VALRGVAVGARRIRPYQSLGPYPHNTSRPSTRFGGVQFVAPLPHLGLPLRSLAPSSLPSPTTNTAASSPPRPPSSTPKRTATTSRSKATFTSTSVLPNRTTVFSFAPSIVRWTRLPTHNTIRCFPASHPNGNARTSPPLSPALAFAALCFSFASAARLGLFRSFWILFFCLCSLHVAFGLLCCCDPR
jgi:hypothetical protein